MYSVSQAFMDAIESNTRKYYWTGTIVTKNKKEYGQIDTIFREKYHPTLGTLFADILLTSGAERVIYSSERK